MLVVLLMSFNAIFREYVAAPDLESPPSSTSNPFPTPYQGKQIYPRRDITLDKGKDNFKHMNLMKLVDFVKGIFYGKGSGSKSINSEQNYHLGNPRLNSEFGKANNAAKYSDEVNIAIKSKPKSRYQNSSDNGKRKVYSKKKSWIRFLTQNDPNEFFREVKHSYKDKLSKKNSNLDKSVQEIAGGQFQSYYSMQEKGKTKHGINITEDDLTKENFDAVKTGIEDCHSASNLSNERIHGQSQGILDFRSFNKNLIRLIINPKPTPETRKAH